MDRRGDEAINWLKGTRAEEEVGTRLDQLKAEGWEVLHNLKKDFGGNIDHLVRGKRGAYAIETKSGRFRHRDVPQAVGNAVWVKENSANAGSQPSCAWPKIHLLRHGSTVTHGCWVRMTSDHG
jgi:hypothetical protein